jgi:hypothetical protein
MNMKLFMLMVVLVLALGAAVCAYGAESVWTVELYTGAPYNFETPLEISQDGEEDIDINSAEYETKPFEHPLYYAWRISRWRDARAWELELVHDKIYLKNKPDEVQKFSISHGLNLLTVNRAWNIHNLIYRVGLGVVIAHPEFEIRGEKFEDDDGLFDSGYHLAGPTAQVAVGKRFYISDNLFVGIEGKLTASYACISIGDVDAEVTNVAVHGLVGLGYEF